MYLAVRYNAYRSTDGRSWVRVSEDAPAANTLVYGDGVWLALTDGDGAWASTDGGETWASASGVGGFWSGVAWADGLFVATAAGQIGHSTDGFTWSWTTGLAAAWVTHCGGRWFVSCENGLLTSTTGLTWVLADGTEAYDNVPVFAGGRWVCLGASGQMRYSTDGLSFTTAPAWPVPNTTVAIDAYGTRGVIGAADGLYASTTMTSWTRVSTLAGAYEVIGGPGGWVATGSDPQWWLATSPDGVTWTVRWTADDGGVLPAGPYPVQLRGRTGRRVFAFAGSFASRDLYATRTLRAWSAALGWGLTTEPPIGWDGVEPPGGQWRLRQRQSLSGADGWPLRQRQNGRASGSWELRQRQSTI